MAYCANASVGARHPASTLAVSASATHTRNRRSVNGPSVCVAWGLHGPMAAHKPSPLRFWRIDSFNCWSAVAGWPEKTGNSPLAQSRRCRLIHLATIFAGFSGFRFQAETDESKMPVSAGFTFWFRFQSGFPGVETVETM